MEMRFFLRLHIFVLLSRWTVWPWRSNGFLFHWMWNAAMKITEIEIEETDIVNDRVCVHCAHTMRIWRKSRMNMKRKIGRSFNYSFIIVICARKSIDCLSLFFFSSSSIHVLWPLVLLAMMCVSYTLESPPPPPQHNVNYDVLFFLYFPFHFVGHRSLVTFIISGIWNCFFLLLSFVDFDFHKIIKKSGFSGWPIMFTFPFMLNSQSISSVQITRVMLSVWCIPCAGQGALS